MPRNRAVAVLIHDDQLLVMFRQHDGQQYYVFPGGGVEDGETPEAAVMREIDEEASLVITAGRLIYEYHYQNGDIHYFYLCDYVSGQPRLRHNTNEYAAVQRGDIHRPMWLRLEELGAAELYPADITHQLIDDLQLGFLPAAKIMRAA